MLKLLTPAINFFLLLLQCLMEYMLLEAVEHFVPGIRKPHAAMPLPQHQDGRFMCQHKIFTACFSQNAWIRDLYMPMFLPIVSPHVIKHTSASCKMYVGKITVIKNIPLPSGAIYINQIITPSGKPAFSYTHKTFVRCTPGVCRFPYHHIHYHMAALVGRLPPMAVKLNGVTSSIKPFQRTIPMRLCIPGPLMGLLFIYFTKKMNIERKSQ